MLHAAQFSQRQQFETRLRAVIGITRILARLDQIKDARQCRIVAANLDPCLGQTGAQVRLPGLIGHRDDAFVSDRGRIDVLIGRGVLQDGAGVQPGLVRKCRGSDIGRCALRRTVQDLFQPARQAGQTGQPFG